MRNAWLVRGTKLIAAACLFGGITSCDFLANLVGPQEQSDYRFYTFFLKINDADANESAPFPFERVAPDRDFKVDIDVEPVGDKSVICLNKAALCDDTVATFLEMTCTGVSETYKMAMVQVGVKAKGTFSGKEASQACIGRNTRQRSAVTWRVIFRRYTNEAVRFHAVVTWTDYDRY